MIFLKTEEEIQGMKLAGGSFGEDSSCFEKNN